MSRRRGFAAGNPSRLRSRMAVMLLRKPLLTLLFASTLTLRAEDWPQFRGPDGEGHSIERGLPAVWSESQNILWKTPVAGRGWSSPVIAGGRVWLTSSVDSRGTASLRLMAF